MSALEALARHLGLDVGELGYPWTAEVRDRLEVHGLPPAWEFGLDELLWRKASLNTGPPGLMKFGCILDDVVLGC